MSLAAYAFLEHHILPADYLELTLHEKAFMTACMRHQKESLDRLRNRR